MPVPVAESVDLTGGPRRKLGRGQRQGQDALIPNPGQNCGVWVSGLGEGPGDRYWGERAVGPGGKLPWPGRDPGGRKRGRETEKGKVMGSGRPHLLSRTSCRARADRTWTL